MRERRERLRLPRGAEVEGVVVREVHHREARPPSASARTTAASGRRSSWCCRRRTSSCRPWRASPRGCRARRRRRDRLRPRRRTTRPPSGGRFGVEPITMSPTAAIVTTELAAALRLGFCTVCVVRAFAFDAAFARRRARLVGDRRGRPVDERARTRTPTATTTAPARTTSASGRTDALVAVAEEDERVVGELRERRERSGDVRHRGGAEHLARAVAPRRR